MTQAKCVSPEKPVASKKCKFHVKREGIEMHHWKCAILKLKCDQRQCEIVLTLTTVGLFSGTVAAAWRAERFQLLGSFLRAHCCTWLWLPQPSGKAVSLPILIPPALFPAQAVLPSQDSCTDALMGLPKDSGQTKLRG